MNKTKFRLVSETYRTDLTPRDMTALSKSGLLFKLNERCAAIVPNTTVGVDSVTNSILVTAPYDRDMNSTYIPALQAEIGKALDEAYDILILHVS